MGCILGSNRRVYEVDDMNYISSKDKLISVDIDINAIKHNISFFKKTIRN